MKRLYVAAGLLWCGAVARADAPIAVPLEVPEVIADDAAAWAGLQSGQLSPEQAWKEGLLDAGAVRAGLAKGVAAGEDEKSKQLRRGLGELLVKTAPASLGDAVKLPKGVQLALADYYASVGDERAAALYEAVVAQTIAPYEQALRLLALGKFWARQKQAQKAQDAFARGRAVLLAEGHNPHLAAEMLLNTAIAWSLAGDEEKARGFYDQTATDGDSWMAAMAAVYPAEMLMDSQQYAQAQQVLEAGLQAQKQLPAPAAPARIALVSRLGALHYIAGDFKGARTLLEEAIALYKTVPVANRVNGIENDDGVARAYLSDIDQWEHTPLASGGEIYVILRSVAMPEAAKVWERKTLYERAVVRGPRATLVEAWVRGAAPFRKLTTVSAFRPAPMAVTSDNPLVLATLSERPGHWVTSYSQNLWVEIASQALQAGRTIEATLTVTSSKFPGCSLPVRVHVEVQPTEGETANQTKTENTP